MRIGPNSCAEPFYGCLSSTYFRVKDQEAFLANPDVQYITEYALGSGFFEPDADGYFAFAWEVEYTSVSIFPDNEDGEENKLTVPDVIQRHILPGDVCRIGISGNEKLRYIGGEIFWITSKGIACFDGCTEWRYQISSGDLKNEIDEIAAKVACIV